MISTGPTLSPPGSSPRVRGKPPRHPVGGAHPRLIPACAGKTATPSCAAKTCAAHPRVCGENERQAPHGYRPAGSSPRVRGKPGAPRPVPLQVRLIPACAGKTVARWASYRAARAHPRVCGENPGRALGPGHQPGSSPRVRGKHVHDRLGGPPAGLIPACAGKTLAGSMRIGGLPAHPRVCGENAVSTALTTRGSGSSPRVRGKPGPDRHERPAVGLIPACAGKTHAGSRPGRQRRAHPRVCGENWRDAARNAALSGSSPRVRGKLRLVACCTVSNGLIPACAGKTPPTTGAP